MGRHREPPAGASASSRPVPDGGRTEEASEFPRPPLSFSDDDGREISIRPFENDTAALAEMYRTMDPADRTQGIPPRSESRLDSWLESLTGEGLNLVAWHGDRAVGHAVLMPMDDDRWELAIFVHSDYQGAHIGSRLIECLFGYGKDHGVRRIWLSVERYNDVALRLYEKVGFEKVSGEAEYKMEREI